MTAVADMDLFLAAIARELKDGERLHVGANQPDVAIAALLARRLWAPRLRMNVAGCWLLGRDSDSSVLGRCSYESDLVDGRSAMFWQARVFDDLRRAPIVFGGGLQIDSRGNANLAGVREGGGWKLRGPGSAGLPTLTTFAPRFYVIAPHHDPRALVETVSEVSVVGDPVERERLGLKPDALIAVITPLARFEPTRDGLVLTEIVTGLSRTALAERTGFAIKEAPDMRTRAPLSDDERRVIAELRAVAATHTLVPA